MPRTARQLMRVFFGPPMIGLLACLLSGCGVMDGTLEQGIVAPPNQHQRTTATVAAMRPFIDETFMVAGADPGVRLCVAQIEPKAMDVQSSVTFAERRMSLALDVRPKRASAQSSRTQPRQTLVLVHGYGVNKETLLPLGLTLAAAGYRVFLPDLRGHGESTAHYVTFGVRETEDILKVIGELERRKKIKGRLGLVGVSMGGAVALACAARDPRIQTVVAIETMPKLTEVAPYYVKMFMPAMSWMLLSQSAVDNTLAQAGQQAGCPIDQFDPAALTPKVRVPILFIHGGRDELVPPRYSERLHAVATAEKRLLILPAANHFDLPLQPQAFRAVLLDWLTRHLKDNAPAPKPARIAAKRTKRSHHSA